MLAELGCFPSISCKIAVRAHTFGIVLSFEMVADVILNPFLLLNLLTFNLSNLLFWGGVFVFFLIGTLR